MLLEKIDLYKDALRKGLSSELTVCGHGSKLYLYRRFQTLGMEMQITTDN